MPKHKSLAPVSRGWRWLWPPGYSIASGVSLYVPLMTAHILYAADSAMSLPGAIHLENFEEDPLQIFPTRWQVRTDRDAASRIYQVKEMDGNRFLHAKTQGKSIQIGLAYPFAP